MSFEELFNFTMQFSDCELLSLEEGHILLKTIVNKSDANPYGMAHGGYLYTLCDNCSITAVPARWLKSRSQMKVSD